MVFPKAECSSQGMRSLLVPGRTERSKRKGRVSTWVWIPIPAWKEQANFWIGLSPPHTLCVKCTQHKHTRITHAATTIITDKVKTALKVIMCECLHVCLVCKHGHTCATQHVWRSEDNFSSQTSPSPEAELGLSGSQGKRTYLRNHHTSPKSYF